MGIAMIGLPTFRLLLMHCRWTKLSHTSLTTFRSLLIRNCLKILIVDVVLRHCSRIMTREVASNSAL